LQQTARIYQKFGVALMVYKASSLLLLNNQTELHHENGTIFRSPSGSGGDLHQR